MRQCVVSPHFVVSHNLQVVSNTAPYTIGEGKNAKSDKKLIENVILADLSLNSIDLSVKRKFGTRVVDPIKEKKNKNPNRR
jgi:hypothetical protein